MMKRVLAMLAALLMLFTTALADGQILRKDAVSALLDGVGRAAIPGMQQVIHTFDDADALPEELVADYSRAANYAIVRRMGSSNLEPDAVLTRAELLAMVGWAAEPKLEDKGSPDAVFTDLPDWSIAPISRLAAAGWLDLYMKGDLTRADGALGADEAATMEELEHFTAKLTELYNTVTPGESFYGYANDQWMRNRELPALTLDLVYGVATDLYQKETAMLLCGEEIKTRQAALIAGIMDGSIPAEEGSAARRFKDMMEICMHGSLLETFKPRLEYGQAQQERIRNAGSMAELMQICIDIYGESAAATLVSLVAPFDVNHDSNYAFAITLNDPVSSLSAWIDIFGMEKARPGMVQYLRRIGKAYGVSMSTEEAESLYAYTARLWDGWLPGLFSPFKMQQLENVYTGNIDSTALLPVLKDHPEINPNTLDYVDDSLSPARFLPAAEVFAACPSLHLDELMQATGLDAIDMIYVTDPALLEIADAFFGDESNLNAAKVIALMFWDKEFPSSVDVVYNILNKEINGYLDEAASFKLEDDPAFCQMDADAETNDAAMNDSTYEAAIEPSEDRSEEGIVHNDTDFDPDAGAEGTMSLEEALSIVTAVMPEIVGEIYAEYYVDQETADVIQRMVDMIIDGYIARFERNTWMDESSRAAALDKLHQMRSFVSFPKGKLVPEITPMSEGGTYLSNLLAGKQNDLRRMAAVCTDPDYRYLYNNTEANVVNCYYLFELNSCYILAGMIQKPFYDPDRSFAGNLGAIGSVIAHEIGHAFDSEGALHDAHGAIASWWTEKDAAIFEERKQEFIKYYSRFRTTENTYQNGEISLAENMADFAGMCIVMDLLEGDPEAQKEAMLGFAGNLAAFSDGFAKEDAPEDVHAVYNVRVDAVIASLDAFYELYEINEYDPMYIAPEERLKLW